MSNKLTPEQEVKLFEALARDKDATGNEPTDERMAELIELVKN